MDFHDNNIKSMFFIKMKDDVLINKSKKHLIFLFIESPFLFIFFNCSE